VSALRTGVRAAGELMITFGLVVLLFVAYELWGTGLQTARAQDKAQEQIEQEWAEGGADAELPVVVSPSATPTKPGRTATPTAPGSPTAKRKPAAKLKPGTQFARIWVPRFGKSYKWVIAEGTDREQLKEGPGHYEGTELPGEPGNFVVSAHRTTYGAPFNKVDLLRTGDAVVIETKTHWFTYRVTDTDIVRPDQVEVTYPVPYRAGVKPAKQMITLTSCHPKFSARQRFIVFGELEVALDKASGEQPPALSEL
jgi:sortase A